MSNSNVKRWREHAHAYREIWKSVNPEDDASLWDAAMKHSVLAEDAFELEAIDARYLKIFNEQMEHIGKYFHFLKECVYASEGKAEEFRRILEMSFGVGLKILYLLMNEQVSLLSFLVAKKTNDEKEIIEQGKRLKEIQEKEQIAIKQKMMKYVA